MAILTKESTAYRGPERRRYRVYRTQNSDYYCREDVCIAVVDRETSKPIPDHPALGLRLSGGICFTPDGGVTSLTRRGEVPQPGETLFFAANGDLERSIRTSALAEVTRPRRDAA